jgi:hypothetical protein
VSLIVTIIYCLVSIALFGAKPYNLLSQATIHILGFLEGVLLLSASTIIALYVVLTAIDHTYNQHHHIFAR